MITFNYQIVSVNNSLHDSNLFSFLHDTSIDNSMSPGVNNFSHDISDVSHNGTLNNHQTTDLNNNNNLSVLYFNARSIQNKIAEFQARVDIEKPHIIAITESWLDDSFNDGEVFPTEYSVFRNDRNTHGDGVALGIRSTLNSVLISDFLSNDIEIVWAEFDRNQGKSFVWCVL